MKAPETSVVLRDAPITIAAARRVAAAVRHCADEAALAAHVREIVRLVPLLQRTAVELGAVAAGPSTFAPGVYTVPLRGLGGVKGLLRHPIDASPLAAEDLNVLHATADLLGALLEVSGRLRESRRVMALMQFLADQMPVGVVCLGPRPAVLACNRAAASFLGVDPTREADGIWLLLDRPAQDGRSMRCIAHGDRLALIDVRPLSGTDPAGSGGVVLVMDCTEQVRAFRDALARETYRCLCEKLPLTVAVVGASGGLEPLVAAAAALQGQLPPGGACGLIDRETFGIVLPGLERPAATLLLRGLPPLRDGVEREVGIATLHPGVRSPDALVDQARNASSAWSAALRPEVFIFDRASVVTETLAFVLRGTCEITCTNRSDRGRELLAERAFDGLILELPPAPESAALDFARHAVALQAGARPFFVTTLPRPWPLRDWGLPEATVFRKPFAVHEVRAAVRAALEGRGGTGG